MYQKVSMASWCRPFDWLPALIAQMLNQPAFLIVPSGFSTISVSLRGRSEMVPWAKLCPTGTASSTRAAMTRERRIVSSSYRWRNASTRPLGSPCSARHVGPHHLGGVDDAVELGLADMAELQGRFLQSQIVLRRVMGDLRGLVVADHRRQRRHQHQRALDVA